MRKKRAFLSLGDDGTIADAYSRSDDRTSALRGRRGGPAPCATYALQKPDSADGVSTYGLTRELPEPVRRSTQRGISKKSSTAPVGARRTCGGVNDRNSPIVHLEDRISSRTVNCAIAYCHNWFLNTHPILETFLSPGMKPTGCVLQMTEIPRLTPSAEESQLNRECCFRKLREMCVETRCIRHSKQNYSKALDDCLAFCAGPHLALVVMMGYRQPLL